VGDLLLAVPLSIFEHRHAAAEGCEGQLSSSTSFQFVGILVSGT